MNPQDRRRAILRLVREREISTQSELAEALREAGHEAVQTTVSRDVSELGLVKMRAESGKLVYRPPEERDPARMTRLANELRRVAVALDSTGNLVVVRTPPGYANALARAIDEAAHPDVAGTVAGDDTIFVAARDGVSGASLRDELAHLTMEGAA
jgi:transcriptional regulator of arginine metabolism